MNRDNNRHLRNMYYKIKVTTKDTRRVLIHRRVPHHHLPYIKLNPNLKVEVLEVFRVDRRRDKKKGGE
tara:strand:- start:306 stop:509 length:204 start_codon:yes stop_codon:yes gene_type:complete